MDENERMAKAIFRYSVISDLVNARNLERGEQERLIEEKCSRKWGIPFSEKTSISRSSILRWMNLYKESGGKVESLCPCERSDKGLSRAFDEDTSMGLIRLRKKMPEATIPHLIDEMNQQGLILAGKKLSPTTVYRFLHQHDLMSFGTGKPQDRRKFEAEFPNDLWQSDVMHGPKIETNGRLRKTYLIAIIDDHSRLIPHAQFYLSEALPSYLYALEEAFLKRGLPRKLYVDNGPAFRSKHLEYITASLNISLIHARPFKPQGKGKIERWFRTVRCEFLSRFKGETLSELNEAIELWITDVYHQRDHSAIGEPPFKRFTSHMECLRSAPDNLKDYFRKVARRKVAKDRTITFKGKLYEVPVALIGKQIEVLYHEDDDEHIEIRYQNVSHGIVRPVNLNVNCRVKRDDNNKRDIIITSSHTDYKGGELL